MNLNLILDVTIFPACETLQVLLVAVLSAHSSPIDPTLSPLVPDEDSLKPFSEAFHVQPDDNRVNTIIYIAWNFVPIHVWSVSTMEILSLSLRLNKK